MRHDKLELLGLCEGGVVNGNTNHPNLYTYAPIWMHMGTIHNTSTLYTSIPIVHMWTIHPYCTHGDHPSLLYTWGPSIPIVHMGTIHPYCVVIVHIGSSTQEKYLIYYVKMALPFLDDDMLWICYLTYVHVQQNTV